jgi:hypothetical protein
MSALRDLLQQAVSSDVLKQVSQRLGADEGAIGNAVSSALPLLVNALAHKSAQPEGAQSLAVETADQDDSFLDDVAGFLGNAGSNTGEATVNNLLGQKREVAETALSNTSGLDIGKASQLLSMLAPVVMGALSRMQKQQGLDANGLGQALQNERQQMQASGNLGGLAQLLDRDGDGQITDDIAEMGAGILGNLMRGNK